MDKKEKLIFIGGILGASLITYFIPREDQSQQLNRVETQSTSVLESSNEFNNTRLVKLEDELKKSKKVGIPVSSTLFLSINDDTLIDKITPLDSKASIVQYNIDTDLYSSEYLMQYSNARRLVDDYLFNKGNIISKENVHAIYSTNPKVICNVKTLAKSLDLWSDINQLNVYYINAFNLLNKKYKNTCE